MQKSERKVKIFVQTYVTRIDWHCPSENKQIVLKLCSMSLNFVHWLKSMVWW